MMTTVTRGQLDNSIQKLDLSGKVVALHSSLRSFGHLEGGAETLIQAFLDHGCTLVVPTFTYTCEAAVQKEIPQNGVDSVYAQYVPSVVDPFFQNNLLISSEMGAIPAKILKSPGVVRGRHPVNSLAAVGPLARSAIEAQDFFNVYAPYKWMYTQPGAALLLVGVTLTSATPIHFGEERAGRRLFRRWGSWEGQVVEVEVGSCSDGFENFSGLFAPIEQNILVGTSRWVCYPFQLFIDRVADAIKATPEITRCALNCPRCVDAVQGGPILPG